MLVYSTSYLKLKGTLSKWLRYGHIIEDVLKVLGSLRNWNNRHVKREVNFVAHGLVKNAIRIFMDNVWLEELPNCIHDIVILE
jgi:hypothetical protein